MSNPNKRKRNVDEDAIERELQANEFSALVQNKEELRKRVKNRLLASPSTSLKELVRAEVFELCREETQKNNEEKQKNKEIIQKLKRFTLKRLFDIQNDDNQDEEISRLREDFKVIPTFDASKSSHTNTSHAKARSQQADFEMDSITYYDQDITLQASCALSSDWPRKYYNEAGVQHAVGLVLEDAVKYVNWVLQVTSGKEKKPSLTSRPEASIFSNKPDHLVVYDETTNLLPILNVEVKKDHAKVFVSDTVKGQIYDYIMVGRLMHGKYTYGVVTTFNQSKVAWADDSECNNVAEVKGRLTEFKLRDLLLRENEDEVSAPTLAKTAASSATHAHTPQRAPKLQIQSQSPPIIVSEKNSPEEPNLSKTSPAGQCTSTPTVDGSCRTLCYSKATYESNKLFEVFCNAIVASLNTEQKKLYTAERPRKRLNKGELVLRLRETKHAWHELDQHISVKEKWDVNSEEGIISGRDFLVLEHLGAGATSRVWRAVAKGEKDGFGYDCVIKYWIRVYDYGEKAYLSSEEVENESRNAATKEVQNYSEIYGNSFGTSMIGRAKLTGRWCVILPFFKPVQNENRTQKTLEKIKGILEERFYVDGYSYQFQECDWRWRHVGYWKDEIVLFDLADLEKKKISKGDHRVYVEEHVAALESRMP